MWACPEVWCKQCRLGPVHGTVATCPSCGRGYVCVTAEERATSEAAMSAAQKPRRKR